MRFITFLAILLVLSGCCSIVNDDKCRVNVVTNDSCIIETISDSINSNGSMEVEVRRSSKPVDLKFSNSKNGTKVVTIKPYASPKFIFGNIITPPGIPLAYLIDFKKKNRHKIFNYNQTIYVDLNSSKNKYYRFGFPADNRHKLSLSLSVPEGNLFYVKNKNSYKSKSGFLGAGVGLNCYFSDYFYINANAKAMMNFIIPVPAAFDPGEGFEFARNSFVSAHIFRDFDLYHLGVGLHYSRFNFDDKSGDPIINSNIKFDSIGLVASVKKIITNKFQVALNYQPSLLNLSDKINFEYSHVIYFELIYHRKLYELK